MTRIGLLGAGGMGNVHMRHYRNIKGVEILLWDQDAEKRDSFQRRWQASAAESFEDLLARCDAVDVCIPTDLHVQIGLKVIAAGKALLIEKPLAQNFEEAMKLYEASEQVGVPFMVGHVARFFPEIKRAHDLVADGLIGNPGVARSRRGGLAPTGSDSWFMDHSRSGGVLLDVAIHEFDWLRWTLGEVKFLNARSVGATVGKGPDYGLTVLTFESGAIAHVESTWMDPSGFRTSYEICGSKGMIEFDSRQVPSLRSHLAGKTFNEAPLASVDDPYFKELSAFVNSVQTGSKPPITGLDGAMAVGISHTAIQSAREGRPLVPPKP